ncbi:MAG: nitrous oxide reductase family maturation protein NosD [Cyclobacteriaceae bacterium]|nr:nitrous oxide reductase family maturation protein NosD [Cyclobacteriaceae bacterium]
MFTGARLLILLVLAAGPAWARVITVGPSRQVSSLQAAVAAAQAGDTVQVHPGTYREGNILIRKPLYLVGVGYPVIDGEGKYEIFTVAATDVVIRGFRLINTGSASINDIAAIKGLDVQRMKILDNQFEETFFGIHLSNSRQTLIEGNTLRGTSGARAEQDVGNGIHLWKCDHITIRKNTVTSHRDGIYFEFVTRSLVEDNYSHQNLRYGLHFMFSHEDEYHNNIFQNNGSGVAIMYTRGVTMTGNVFEYNQGAAAYALLLKDISDSRIERCQFRNNTVAIYMEGSSRCILQDNGFRENGWALKIQASCDNNTLTRNNFIRNTFDVATNGSLSLNTLTSNYWDKYEGYDINRDGVGDVPFHPVSLYGMIVERMPTAVLLWRSFLVFLLDRAEKVVPAVTPENLKDEKPAMRSYDRG